MSSKTKRNGKALRKPVERPGVQVVLFVPAETRALLDRTAKDLCVSMNAAGCERPASGRWPAKVKEERS